MSSPTGQTIFDNQNVEQPVEQPVEQSAEQSVEQTVEQSVEQTVERPIERIIEQTDFACHPSTDRKPLCMFGFMGTRNNCLRFLHHSVKPVVGVVKYDFSTWNLFPTTISQAQELAVKWSNSFEKRKDFVDKSVIIFFHLQMKTIRVEVKTNSTKINSVGQTDCKTESEQHAQSTNTVKVKRVPYGYSKYYPAHYPIQYPAQYSIQYPAQYPIQYPAQYSAQYSAQYPVQYFAQYPTQHIQTPVFALNHTDSEKSVGKSQIKMLKKQNLRHKKKFYERGSNNNVKNNTCE